MRKLLLAISTLLWCGFSNAASNVSFLNFRKKQAFANVDEKLVLTDSPSADSYWVKSSDSHVSHMSHRSHYSHYSSTIVSSTHDSIQTVSKSQKEWIVKNIAKDSGLKSADVKLKYTYFAKNCSITMQKGWHAQEKETIPNDIRVLYCKVDLGYSVLEYIIPIQGKYKVYMFNDSWEHSQEISPWMKVITSK